MKFPERLYRMLLVAPAAHPPVVWKRDGAGRICVSIADRHSIRPEWHPSTLRRQFSYYGFRKVADNLWYLRCFRPALRNHSREIHRVNTTRHADETVPLIHQATALADQYRNADPALAAYEDAVPQHA